MYPIFLFFVCFWAWHDDERVIFILLLFIKKIVCMCMCVCEIWSRWWGVAQSLFVIWNDWFWSTCFCFSSCKDSQKQALKMKDNLGDLGWKSWIRVWLPRLEDTHLQHFLLTWLLSWKDPSLSLTLVFVWNFELCRRWKTWVTFLSWKDPLVLPNSYAQSEFWNFLTGEKNVYDFLEF